METFFELSLILSVATIVAGVMRLLKQPIIVGYIITGLLVSPSMFGLVSSYETMHVFSEMGIAILLFIVGLHLNPNELKNYGRGTFIVSFGQVVLTGLLGFIFTSLLSFSLVEALYLSLALTFSSTIVVLKLLTDKKDIEQLHGKISIGVLLLQDIVAALALVVATTFSEGSGNSLLLVEMIIKGLGLALLLTLISVYVLPKLTTFFAHSQEFLFLFSLAWGLGLASVFYKVGFSIEIGALMAGVALSVTPYSYEISAKLKSLRDFFVVMFFIVLGSTIDISALGSVLVPLIALLIFAVLVKPLIVMVLCRLAGYTKRTGFLSGISLAQISEFSMILIILGVRLGHIKGYFLPLVTTVGMLSILVSSYAINYSERLYGLFSPLLSIFDNGPEVEEVPSIANYDVILFGCHRSGYDFIKIFGGLKSGFLAVDFDPDVVRELKTKNINCKYGDAEDAEFLEDISVQTAVVVISTIPNHKTNMFLLGKIRAENKDCFVILISDDVRNALKLYKEGATYVLLPHFIGGEFAADLLKEVKFDSRRFDRDRKDHIKYLKERLRLGHVHPAA